MTTKEQRDERVWRVLRWLAVGGILDSAMEATSKGWRAFYLLLVVGLLASLVDGRRDAD